MTATHETELRRHPDGAIDIGFYRRRIDPTRAAFLAEGAGRIATAARRLWRRLAGTPVAIAHAPATGLKKF
ncbi:hypothetical protein [Stella sp.]|uniref:hypothetical protein n=1 Tax=Stella sp. TaxID=2912054 RepID=UPI0035AEDAA3